MTSASVTAPPKDKDTSADGLPLPWAWQKLLAERAKQTGLRRQRAAAAAAADGSMSEVLNLFLESVLAPNNSNA